MLDCSCRQVMGIGSIQSDGVVAECWTAHVGK